MLRHPEPFGVESSPLDLNGNLIYRKDRVLIQGHPQWRGYFAWVISTLDEAALDERAIVVRPETPWRDMSDLDKILANDVIISVYDVVVTVSTLIARERRSP